MQNAKCKTGPDFVLSRHFYVSVALLLWLVIILSGCGVSRQVRQASSLATCDFRIRSVEKVTLAGVVLDDIKSINDLSFSDVALIMAGLASPVFPLSLQINVEVRNPNPTDAGLNRLEWILFIDDVQMTSGIVEEPFIIPAMGVSVIPVAVGLDLKQVLSGKPADALLNFCMNLSGAGKTPTRVKIRLKPTILVAGTALKYPGYITVNTSYSGK